MFKANQLFPLEINVLYSLMFDMGMFTYVIKIASKIPPFCSTFVDIIPLRMLTPMLPLQDWSPLFADVVFTRNTFHLNLRNTDVFPLAPGAPKWNKERPKTAIRPYEL